MSNERPIDSARGCAEGVLGMIVAAIAIVGLLGILAFGMERIVPLPEDNQHVEVRR